MLRHFDKYIEKAKILVVDHNDDNAYSISNILIANSFQVIPCKYGKEALGLAIESVPDLVLMRIDLPDINSFEIFKNFKRNGKLATIPIIFITSSREVDDLIKSLNMGATDYISLPINQGELIARIKTHLINKFAIELIIQQNKELSESTQDLANALMNLKIHQEKEIEMEKLKSVLAMAVTTNHELKQPLAVIQGNIELLILKHPELKDNKNINRIFESLQDITTKIAVNTNIDQVLYKEYANGEEMVDT
ncbi:MAG TPA: response regulator [Candidatus Cloacimonadota bacterium]|jgi:DNA-binding response OmpR family regulator|nr:response regulator [Candidatus Cloacimonadales bacterium]HPK41655.1 response regulator [Candidatus Cloacimonadota bacterium]HPY96580.1 response regulator [Candidatus Cloacimonadota bacterium]HQB41185.1 response regulator [Candidatus Cloacimonadota bacterium]